MGIYSTSFTLNLPEWAEAFLASHETHYFLDEQKMWLAIELARRNVTEGTGGPFGAAIFERETGKLISIGVNRVVGESCSIGHAELFAIAIAQRALGAFSLRQKGRFELFTSAQPCAMCFGAIPWSGIERVVIAASAFDTESLARFDEGPIHPNWRSELENRGIVVQEGVLQEEAKEVLRAYRTGGGIVYNGNASLSSENS